MILSVDSVVNAFAGRNDDAFWRLRWLNRHADGVEVYYAFDRYDPTKGWISKAGLRDVDAFDGETLSTNSRGFRGTVDFAAGRNPDKFRVVVLGDSFTFGDEVSDNETYSYFLQLLMPETEIINLGVHGYGQDQMLILLREEAIRFRPDVIIVGFVYADIFRNALSFRDFAKPKFRWNGHQLVLENSPVPSPETVVAEEWKRLKLLDIGRMFVQRIANVTGLHERRVRTVTSHIMDEMTRTAATVGARIVFAYLPVSAEITDLDLSQPREAYILDYCKSNLRAQCISLLPQFDAERSRGSNFRQIGHWDTMGHKTVAAGLHKYFTGVIN